MILDSKQEEKFLYRMAAGIPRNLSGFNISCMKCWPVVAVVVVVVVVEVVVVVIIIIVVIPKKSNIATFKKNTIYLNAVILFRVLSTRYEGTLSSVTLYF